MVKTWAICNWFFLLNNLIHYVVPPHHRWTSWHHRELWSTNGPSIWCLRTLRSSLQSHTNNEIHQEQEAAVIPQLLFRKCDARLSGLWREGNSEKEKQGVCGQHGIGSEGTLWTRETTQHIGGGWDSEALCGEPHLCCVNVWRDNEDKIRRYPWEIFVKLYSKRETMQGESLSNATGIVTNDICCYFMFWLASKKLLYYFKHSVTYSGVRAKILHITDIQFHCYYRQCSLYGLWTWANFFNILPNLEDSLRQAHEIRLTRQSIFFTHFH